MLGSINMDLVVSCATLPHPGETIVAKSSSEVPGGKGANQAVAASRCGGVVSMIGRVGDDAFANRLVDNLRRDDVQVDAVQRLSECSSGIAVVSVESSGENSIIVVPGANGRLSPDDLNDVTDLITQADQLVMQLEIPLETVAAANTIAKSAGVRTILDPAPMPSSLGGEILDVDLICPNQSEASQLLGSPIRTKDDAIAAIPRLHRMGPRNVVITLGRQGTVISNGSRHEFVPPFPVTAIDTTAAGDAFAGALAVRLAEGSDLWEAARFASAAGALAATRSGAQPSMPQRTEIESLLDRNNSSH